MERKAMSESTNLEHLVGGVAYLYRHVHHEIRRQFNEK